MTKTTGLGIRELAELAKKKGAIDLAQGIIDNPPPQTLIEALDTLDPKASSTYNNKRGVDFFRTSIQNYLISRNWKVEVSNIMATAGAIGGITAALLTSCKPGSTVLLPEPFFTYHDRLLKLLGYKTTYFPLPLGEAADWANFLEKMNEVDAVLLTTPANPTGHVVSPDILQKMSERAVTSNCLLIVDEMYREFIWDNSPADDAAYESLNLQNTVIVRSFSKTFCIPGWRIGFLVSSSENIESIAATHDLLYIGGSTLAQYSIATALSNNTDALNDYVVLLRELLLRNKERLTTAFTDFGMTCLPVPATYYMIIKHGMESDEAAMEALLERNVVVTPLNIVYSNPDNDTGYIRIHFAASEDNVSKVIDSLKG